MLIAPIVRHIQLRKKWANMCSWDDKSE